MLIRANFPDLRLEDALPAIDVVIFDSMSLWPPIGPSLYRTKKSKRDIEQITQVTGLGSFTRLEEGEPVRYDQPLPGFNKTYRHVAYGLGYRTSHEMVLFDRLNQVADMARQLSHSRQDNREVLAATTFNLAFDAGTPIPDGQALCSLSHPLIKAGGVHANRPSVGADLSVDSLQLALTDFRQFRWHSGKRMRLDPKTLLVPSQLEWAAVETLNLGNGMRSDTTNNTTNAFNHRIGVSSGLTPVVWQYLLDPRAWFLLAAPEETDLRWYDAEAFHTMHEKDFDTRSYKTAGWEMFSFGPADWRGVYGNPGGA